MDTAGKIIDCAPAGSPSSKQGELNGAESSKGQWQASSRGDVAWGTGIPADLDRGLGRPATYPVHWNDCDWGGALRGRHGLLARSPAGAIRCDQVSARHPVNHHWKFVAQCDACATARFEHRFAPIVPCDSDELYNSFRRSRFFQSPDRLSGVERSAFVRGLDDSARDIQRNPTHACLD